MEAPSEPPAQDAEDGSCAVCAQRRRATVFTTCGHHILCEPCTVELVSRGQPCPVCREDVDGAAGWRTLPAAAPGLAAAPSFMPDAIDDAARAKTARTAWRKRVSKALGDLMVGGEDVAFLYEQYEPLEGDNAALTLRCDGVDGELALPLSAGAVDALRAAAQRAPFGLDAATVVDTAVRDAWQLDASAVHLDAAWDNVLLGGVLAEAMEALHVPVECGVEAQLYKLVLYEENGHFKRHRDTEKAPGMFGTLVLQLPVEGGHDGAVLTVQHRDQIRHVFFDTYSGEYFAAAAFYADCEHELAPQQSGRRVCLVYNLVATTPGERPPSLDAAATALRSGLAAAVAAWPAEHPARIVVPLDHQYTRTNLSLARLKGTDAILVGDLRGLTTAMLRSDTDGATDDSTAAQPLLECALVLIERELYGSSEYSLHESGVRVAAWVGPDNAELPENCSLGSLQLNAANSDRDAELLPDTDEYTFDLTWPDEREVEPDRRRRTRYTGNSGPEVNYWYHKAAVVFWPRKTGVVTALRLGGLGAALALAAARAARGDADAADALEYATSEGEARALAAAAEREARLVAEAAEDAEDAAAGRPQRYRWHGHHSTPELGDSALAAKALATAARQGASAAACACRVLRTMAMSADCLERDVVVAPLATLATILPASCLEFDAALAALLAAALKRGQRANCLALAIELAARDCIPRADLVAGAILKAQQAAAAEEDSGAFVMPAEGPLHDLALLSFAHQVTAARAVLPKKKDASPAAGSKAASDEEVEESAGNESEDEWQGSSRDGSHCSDDS